MKVIITFIFCFNNLWKSKFMALEKPGKLGIFFSYFVAILNSFKSLKDVEDTYSCFKTVEGCC